MWFHPPQNWPIELEKWSSFCVIASWEIWKSRCQRTFQNLYVSPARIASFIDITLGRLQKLVSPNSLIQKQLSIYPTIWIPPKKNVIKINVDISFRSAGTAIGFGFVFRDSMGTFLLAGSKAGHAGTAEQAECWGIYEALQQGLKYKLRNIQIESDNKAAVDYLLGKQANLSWTSTNILDNAKNLVHMFSSVNFCFCYRSGNAIAHMLAARADLDSTFMCVFVKPPDWLLNQLKLDILFCNLQYC
ncbi:hypothetical protein FRX31_013668 [Thalictrum thalictroides]|uniref:RNase H type-1 domain-containing protein n=1 Tax=Thalictrum thalictroides TaxID=46969 RepID=A0A7J6WJU8_THATH|nr:hypothetical protein FRX31_013668 [Thalictrum thalictroides]